MHTRGSGLSVDPLQILVHPPTDPELTSWISGVTAAASQLLSNRYLTQLVNAVGDGSIRSYSPRRYYRERLNPVQAATPIVGQDLGAALCAVLIDLDNHGYFDDAFGPSCCDERADRAGAARSLFAQLLGPETPWQWVPSSDGQDLDHVYDLVEVCHDVVSRPRTRTYHGYCKSGTTTGSTGRLGASCMCGGSTLSSLARVWSCGCPSAVRTRVGWFTPHSTRARSYRTLCWRPRIPRRNGLGWSTRS